MTSPRRVFFWLLLAAAPSLHAQSPPLYPGAEASAPWRKEAENKINQLRKANLIVKVEDASGAPLKDAAITLKQQRHAFPFSILVDPAMFDPAEEDEASARIYREKVAALFDMPSMPAEAEPEAMEKVRQWALGLGLLDPATRAAATEICPVLTAASLPHPAELMARLAEITDAQKPLRLVHPTFPVDPANADALKLQAFYLRDLLTAAFAHERVGEVEFAQLWNRNKSPSDTALFNHYWSARPVAEMLEQLLRKTWWTEDGGLTSATGEWKNRAFLGEYRISVSDGTRTRTVSASLTAPESMVKVTLADEPPAPSPTSTPE